MSLNIEKTYKKVTQIEHILMRPDMYVGSVTTSDEQLWVLGDDHFQF
jgi:DNA topoisomerase II